MGSIRSGPESTGTLWTRPEVFGLLFNSKGLKPVWMRDWALLKSHFTRAEGI